MLLAQHAAIAHQLDHATGAPAQQSSLCDAHDLLGTVLGAVSSVPVLPQLLSLADTRALTSPAAAPQPHPFSPKSRGPPTFS